MELLDKKREFYMRGSYKVVLWGTRGTFPQASKEYLEYGGNTSCISVECEDRLIVFDAGSGLACLGKFLTESGNCPRIDLFISHVHMDHIMGFYNFQPFFNPGAEIHIYGEEKEGVSVKEQIRRVVDGPYWPVGVNDFPAAVRFHTLEAGKTYPLAEDLAVGTVEGNHPNGSILYRLELGEKSVVYGLDCEMDEATLERLASFSAGCDLLICDAQYTEEELPAKTGWGHSSWQWGIRLKEKAGAKTALMTHYSWDYTDEQIKKQEMKAKQEHKGCLFAREGMEILL